MGILPHTVPPPTGKRFSQILGLTTFDVAVLAVTFLFAFAVRLPYLQSVPRYTDEVRELEVAIGIVQGRSLPLTNYDAYMGAFVNYLEAAAFFVFGAQPYVPRLLTAVISAATVSMTYLLGRSIADRWTGLIASLLLAGNAANVVDNAHIAYSHSVTPFVTTLMLLGFSLALKRTLVTDSHTATKQAATCLSWQPLCFLGGAFCFGLALQTHPTAFAFAPGLGAVFLIDSAGRRLLSGRSLGLAAGFAALGYSNMIVFNVGNAGRSIVDGVGQMVGYAENRTLGLELYPAHLLIGMQTLLATIEGDVGFGTYLPHRLVQTISIISVSTVVLGIILLVLRCQFFVPLLLITWTIVLPIMTAFRTQLDRYWMPALPLAAIASAVVLTYLTRWLGSRLRQRPVVIAAGVLVAILVTYSWPGLARRYEIRSPVRPTNAELDRLAALIVANTRADETVLLEWYLFSNRQTDEDLESQTLRYLLRLQGIPVSAEVFPREHVLEILLGARGQTFLFVSPGTIVPSLRRVADVSDVYDPALQRLSLSVSIVRAGAYQTTFQTPVNLTFATDSIFGAGIHLLGYRLNRAILGCGETIPLRLYWQRVGPVDADYTVFTHIVVGDRVVSQQDGQPRDGLLPTTAWASGEVVTDEYGVSLPSPCPDLGLTGRSATARIEVGLYDRQTMRRLPVVIGGRAAGTDSVVLPTTLTLMPSVDQ